MSADSEQLSPVEVLAEEFLERQQRGEKPTIAEYCERHPELAEEIREVFEALAMMEELKPDSHDVTGSFGASIQHEGKRLERVGDYRILREIGRGGMGIVYEAEQESLRRRVALKVLSKRQTVDAKGLQRFQREARAAARMHHTNIVPVFDVGDDDEHVYYAMQMIQGQGLDLVLDDLRRLRTEHVEIRKNASVVEAQETREDEQRHSIAASLFTGKFHQENLIAEARREERAAGSQSAESTPRPATSSLDPQALGGAYAETVLQDSGSTSAVLPGHSQLSTAETNRGAYFRSVAEIGLQTGRALSYAHARGIIHRDIKPSNLLLDAAGVVWVTDFGLAKTSDEAMTHTGDILGTIRYMSPERFKGQCDVRADIYALGLTLYELLVLRPAYASPDRLRLIELVTATEPPTPRSLDPRIPRDLETIILKSIDKDPRRRYQSADELCEDLERFIQDEPIKARRISLAERFARWARRNKSLAATLAVLITVVTSVAIGSTIMAGYFRNLNTKLSTTLTDLEREKGISDARAQENQELAVAMRAEANRAGIAEDQALEALGTIAGQQELMRLNSFVTETQLAQLVGETGDLAARERWLRNWRTTDPERDLRGWEWYHLMCEGQRDFYEIRNHDDMLICIEWSPDGTQIASGGYSGDIHISDAQSGELRQTLKGHGSYVYAVRWNKTGNRLVSCGYDGTIRIWDVNTGQVIRQIDIPEAYVYGVDWDPAGERIASTERHGPVRIWNAETGEELASFHIDVELLAMIAWHPQEDRIAVSGLSQNVYVLDAATGAVAEILQHPADAYVYGLDWSPDGERLVSADNSGNCFIWQPGVSEPIATIESSSKQSFGMASVRWSPNGRWLAITRHDRGVTIIDAETHEELLQLRGDPGFMRPLSWSHDSRRLASTQRDGSIRIWDVSDPESVPQFDTGSHAVTASDWSADSRYFYTGDDDGRVRGWNAATREPMPGFEFSDSDLVHVEFMRLSPDGTKLAVGGRPENDVWIVDADSGEIVQRLTGPTLEGSSQPGVRAIAWDESNERLAVGDSSGEIWIANLQTGEHEKLHQFSGAVHDLCYLPQAGGRWIFAVSAQDYGTLTAFDLESGEIEQEVRVGLYLWSLAVDRQGTRIAVGGGLTESGDRGSVGLARVWRVHREDDQLELRDETTLEGPGTLVDTVRFSSDGSRLMAVEHDGRVSVWDTTGDMSVPRRRLLITLDADVDVATSLAISPDGLQVAVTSADGKFRVWNALLGYKNELSPVLLPILEQRALAGTATADDLLLRARILARQADWSTAAASLEALSELPDSKPWYISDLWVLDGPFPGEIETLHAPEAFQSVRDGDVLEPVASESEAGDPQEFHWRPRTLQDRVVIDFGEMFNNSSNVAGYALLRIYSAREQSVGLVFGADDHLRLWLNGELLQTVRPNGANPDDFGRPIDLQRGWNSLLAKVVNLQGRHQLFLNLSDETPQLAELYENAGEFAAAEEMWNRVLDNSGYYVHIRYAQFLWRRGRFADAQRELDQILEYTDVESEYLQLSLAAAYFDQERYDEALAELDRGIELNPESINLIRTRADYNAQLRRYAAAAGDTRAIIDLDPTEHSAWCELVQLLLQTGDVAGYEAVRHEMLEQWKETDDPTLAERTIKACLTNPADTETLDQLELLMPVVRGADQEHQYFTYFLAVQGFFDYRRGVALLDAQNSEEAQTLFQSALGFFSRARSRGIGAKWAVHVDLCAAMTLYRMERPEPAGRALEAAENRLASSDFVQTSDPLDLDWNEDLLIRHTYREAIALIRGPAYEELDMARETLAAGDLAAAADHLETAVSMTGTAPVILRDAIALIDHARAGYVPLISTSESEAVTWQVAVSPPAAGWETEADAAVDDWESLPGPFGSYDVLGVATTPWPNENEIWLRREFEVSETSAGQLAIWAWCDDRAEFYINGVLAAESGWTGGEYRMLTLRLETAAAIRPGRNILAVHASNTIGGGALDVGLYLYDGQSRRAVLDAIETGLASAQLSGIYQVDALIQLERWHEAALAMRERLRLNPPANLDDESVDWMRYVTLHATAYSEGQGEMQDYVDACQEMMDRYRDVSGLTEQEQRMVVERIVKCCCLLPADVDWSAFDTGPGRDALAEGRLEVWQPPWYAMAYGMESLRLGGPDNSREALALVQHGLDTLQHTPSANVREYRAATLYAIASLAHLALGDRDQAEASLAAAIAATPPVLEHNPDGSIVGHTAINPAGGFLHDLLPPEFLMREATSALEQD